MSGSSNRHLPLDGHTVFEIGQNVAAPFAGQILADLGAEVIKIEKPRGDDARHWGPPDWEGASAMFQTLNRNKTSQVCDFRDAAQVARLRDQILRDADVVIQNFRPGVLESLGLDAGTLQARKPELVYCDMGAFGRGGPLSGLPGYDPLMQAYGGLMSVTGEPGQAPVRTGYSVIDCATGMWAAIGILSALLQRRQDRKGTRVEVSLFETALGWMQVAGAQHLASGEIPGRHGSGAATIVPYGAYLASDGHLVIAAGNDALFGKLSALLGHPEWADDPRFRSNPARVVHRKEIDRLIQAEVALQTRDHWIMALRDAQVPCAPVQDTAEAFGCEQARALGVLQDVPGSAMKFMGLPLRLDGRRPEIRKAPPALNTPKQEATA
ncbi:CaiB/BaiF CoA transferase family protein [Parapusillimonas granuli]|uniref:CoA transferase n=1 Tax=Parapusillimonas granuli TaxID=380911 RepID=A0A853FZ95_9BURK|nr:CoA transferase [Parapusillimonas granuli]MBB5216554.1 crotonobetainyl-CoA:carnitine CoA-transferase CaiB-like acyl-CoA transferase [Parapusillimonas granuli]MEB2399703.1 CoA transferase [Alcaligenaceae bacterium]NYT48140.1 CoA transferase [Parapusillimonas granuli]